MFVLRVTYLMNRVYSARCEHGDAKREPEWPPHPARLFSALTAAWGDGGAEEELRPALEWLEALSPPTIYAGDYFARHLVQAFVPINDSSLLPEERSRKPRTFPSAALTNPDVYFAWNSSLPDEIAPALNRILQRTSSLGHSSSLVAVEIAQRIPGGSWNVWVANANDGERLRVPHSGRLAELIIQHRKFQSSQSKVHRPSLGKTTLYSKPMEVRKSPAGTVFDRMIILQCDEGPRCSLPLTLSVLAALRGAILKLAPQPLPEFLSGHAPSSTPENPVRSDSPHVALVPLPNVGGPHATGYLLGIAALLPRALSATDRETCWDVIGQIQELGMPWGEWRVSLTDAEEHRRALLPETWVGPSKVWSTVTPFVFDRFPRDPYGAEAEEVVREAFSRVGLPEPIDLDLHYNPWHIGVPRAAAFRPAPSRAGKPQRYHCHVRAEFATPVAGPLVAGAGRYYGYGFFRSLRPARDPR